MPGKHAEQRPFLLDTSAILTLLEGEYGIESVKALLRKARRGKTRVFVSLMSIYEILYLVTLERGEEQGLRRVVEVRGLPIEETPLSADLAVGAAHLKAAYRVSVADSWIAATAIEKNAILVHKDPELLALGDLVDLETLPLK